MAPATITTINPTLPRAAALSTPSGVAEGYWVNCEAASVKSSVAVSVEVIEGEGEVVDSSVAVEVIVVVAIAVSVSVTEGEGDGSSVADGIV